MVAQARKIHKATKKDKLKFNTQTVLISKLKLSKI